jgi:hypothetical protein
MGKRFSALPISQCSVIMPTLPPLYSFVLVSFGSSTSASIIRIFRVYLQYKRGSQPREASQLLFTTFRPVFLVLNTCQILLSLGLGASFILLTLVNGEDWLKFLFSSIVLSSMVGQVRKTNHILLLLSLTALVCVGNWKLAPRTACLSPSCASCGVSDGCWHIPWRCYSGRPTQPSWTHHVHNTSGLVPCLDGCGVDSLLPRDKAQHEPC